MSTKKSNISKAPKISTIDHDEEPSHDNVTGEGCVRKDNIVNVRNEEELENTKIVRPQLRKHDRQNAGHSKSKLVADTSNGSRKAICGPMSHMKKKGCDDISRDNHQSMSLEKDSADQNVNVTRGNSDIVVEADGEESEFFKCGFSECHSSYCDEVSMNAHITEAHQAMTLFPCYYCSCLWSTCKNLLVHLPSHIGSLPYRCVQCDICFAKRSFLREHLNKMHKVNKPFKCQFTGCAFVSKVWSEFKAHNSIIHPLEDTYRCFACKIEMTTREALFEHIEMYMVTLICCSYCTMKARTRQRILRHSNNIHQGLDVRFTVQITVTCVSETTELEAPTSVPTSTVSSEQELIRSHRNVACEEGSSMGEHVKCHESGYNLNLAFQCSLCPFVSDELQDFSLHLANHCGKTSHSFRHYKCVHCQYTSNVMTLMEEHLQENHENDLFKFEVVQEVVKSNPVPEYVHSSSDASADSAQLVININDAPQSIRGTQNKHVHYGVLQGASRIQPKYAKGDSSQGVPNTRQNAVVPKSGSSASQNSTKCNVEDDTTRHAINDNAQRRTRTNGSSSHIVLKRKLLIVLERCDVLMGIAEQNGSAGGNEDTHSPKKIQKFHNGTRSANNSRDQDNIEASAQECRNETNTKMRSSQTDIHPGRCDPKDDTCTETLDSHDNTCTKTHDSNDDTSTDTHDSHDSTCTETHDSQVDINTETHDSHDDTCMETHDSHDGTYTETRDSHDDTYTETHDFHDGTCTETHDSYDGTFMETRDSHDGIDTETLDSQDVTCTETRDSHDDTCTEKHDSHDDTCTETRDSHDDTCTETRDSHDDTCMETHDSQDDINTETHDSQDYINTETPDSQEDSCTETHDSHDDTCSETRDSHDDTCTETRDSQDDTCTETHDSHDDTCTETRDYRDDINTETHESHDDTCMETHDSQDDTSTKTRDFRYVTRTETRVSQEDIRSETINSRDETCTESQDDTSIEIQHSVDSFSTHPIEETTVTTVPVDAVQTLHTEPEEESPEINTILCRVPENTKYRCNVCVFHCQTWELFETHMAEAHYYRIVKPDARSPPQTIIAVPIKKTSHTLNPHRRGRYVCDDCTFATDVKGNIQRHREGHSDKLPSGYKCSFCSYSSRHRFVITRHAKKYHTCELSGQPYDVSILSSKIVAIQMENPQTTTECSKPTERNIKSSDVPCTENDPDLPLSGIPVSRCNTVFSHNFS